MAQLRGALTRVEITTVVHVREALAAKLSAMAAHESQVGDFGRFLAMPAAQVEAAFGQESFRRRGRATPSQGTATLETALPL
jgi:LmbE family N-acetylglucosaminyl deacetylase